MTPTANKDFKTPQSDLDWMNEGSKSLHNYYVPWSACRPLVRSNTGVFFRQFSNVTALRFISTLFIDNLKTVECVIF